MIKISEELIIETAFKNFREGGFPYIKLSDYEILQEFKKLQECKSQNFIKRKNGFSKKEIFIEKSSLGQNICYNFMPHEFDVFCLGSSGTVIDAFNDDKKLLNALKLVMKYDHEISTKPFIARLKRSLGTQFAGNFRPSIAKYIVEAHVPKNGIYYDYSCGFGGRLIGFLSSADSETKKYIGCEPNTKTFLALKRIYKFFKARNVKIYQKCSEEFSPKELKNSVDLASSSPPYFNKEIYSDEETQSYNKYKSYNDWLENYWLKTIENCHYMLKDNGNFIVNIANVKIKNQIYPLEEDTIKLCNKIFSKKENDYKMFLGGFGSNRKKIERFFIFKK